MHSIADVQFKTLQLEKYFNFPNLNCQNEVRSVVNYIYRVSEK